MGIKPLMGSTSVTLRSNKISVSAADNLKGYTTVSYNNMLLLIAPKDKGSFSLNNIDLTGIAAVELMAAWDKPPQFGYAFELRLDSPDGKKVGEGTLPGGLKDVKGPGGFGGTAIQLDMVPVTDGKFHNLYIVSQPNNPGENGTLVIRSAEFKAK